MSGQQTNREKREGRSAVEWVTLIISTTIVLSLVGLIVYEYFGQSNGRPEIVVNFQREQVRKVNHAYSIPVIVTNRGEQTATNVRLIISLGTSETGADQTDLQIDFLDGGATERRLVVVGKDPSQMDLRVVSISFGVP